MSYTLKRGYASAANRLLLADVWIVSVQGNCGHASFAKVKRSGCNPPDWRNVPANYFSAAINSFVVRTVQNSPSRLARCTR